MGTIQSLLGRIGFWGSAFREGICKKTMGEERAGNQTARKPRKNGKAVGSWAIPVLKHTATAAGEAPEWKFPFL